MLMNISSKRFRSFWKPYSRFPLQSLRGFSLQSGLIEKCIEFLLSMKNTLLLLSLFSLIGCQNKEKKTATSVDQTANKFSGKELFEGEGNCVACHKPNQKVIGPSLQEIGKIYKAKKGSIVLFLQDKSEPIVDPSQYEIMKTNFAITKSMSDEQVKALEDYIYSFSK